VAGSWLSNPPLGVMACYLLAAVAVLAAAMRRSWAPVVRAGIAGALGMGAAAVYLIPAAVEQKWIAVGQAVDDAGERIENSWLLARHADPALALHDVELRRVSIIAVVMVVIAVVGFVLAWQRGKLRERRETAGETRQAPLAESCEAPEQTSSQTPVGSQRKKAGRRSSVDASGMGI